MIFKGLQLTRENSFVAMQYYWLMLNRTYLAILTKNSLLGIVANGLVSDEGNDVLANYLVRKLVIRGDLDDPFSYVKSEHIEKATYLDLEGDEILAQNNANFRLHYQDITSVQYDPKKKWGMGKYPHDGKIYIESSTRKTIELIILGNQSGADIRARILSNQENLSR